MRLAVVVVAAVISTYSAAAAIWLLITGRGLPGILGRGFTKSDNLRLRRTPALYFRAMGTLIGVSAVNVALLGWAGYVLTSVSLTTLEVIAAVAGILILPTGAAIAWVFVLAARYRLFRWDKP